MCGETGQAWAIEGSARGSCRSKIRAAGGLPGSWTWQFGALDRPRPHGGHAGSPRPIP